MIKYQFSINLDKLDKTKFIKGKKGNYLSGTFIIRDEKDKYGNDGFIVEFETKEEREKKKSNIVGNIKKVEYKQHSEPSTVEDNVPF
jgi:hypothetical protein